MEEKFIAALLPAHGTDLADSLRASLLAAGASRVQVNLDDTAVADAPMRFGVHAEPTTAVLSVWTDSPAKVLTLLAPVADVWRVDERRPMEPPVQPDGSSEPWLANLAFLRRPAEMSHEAWLAHWLNVHTTVAIETQDTYGYIQNIVVETLTDHPGRDASRVTGIVEELFLMDAKHDSHVFYGSGGDKAELRRRVSELMASVAVFGADRDLDLVPTTRQVHAQPASQG